MTVPLAIAWVVSIIGTVAALVCADRVRSRRFRRRQAAQRPMILGPPMAAHPLPVRLCSGGELLCTWESTDVMWACPCGEFGREATSPAALRAMRAHQVASRTPPHARHVVAPVNAAGGRLVR